MSAESVSARRCGGPCRVVGLSIALLTMFAAACGTSGDGLVPPPPPPALPPPPPVPGPAVTGPGPFLVSNAGTGSGAGLLDGSGGGFAGQAWVSLRPGALPGIATVTLRVRRSGTERTAELTDGGLDPVAIPATAGDTIVLSATPGSGPPLGALVFIVPERKPPTIVRTVPPKGTRDVALNTRFQVVFSEPIASSALTNGAIQVRQNGEAVPGQVRFLNADHTFVEVVLDGPLVPGTDYELVVTDALRDLDGTAFETVERTSFTTTTNAPPPLPPLPSGTLAFVRDGRIWLAGPAGQAPLSSPGATERDYDPAWSPDGSRIAFLRWSGGRFLVRVMAADGSGEITLAEGSSVSWSADGQRILYSAWVAGSGSWDSPPEGHVLSLPSDGSAAVPDTVIRVGHWGGHFSPVIGPDGSRMAAAASTIPGNSWVGSLSSIVLVPMGVAGSVQVLLTPPVSEFPISLADLRWSPDGQHIAFTECAWEWFSPACGGGARVGLVDADGRGYRIVTDWGDSQSWKPSWSPDGTWLTYASNDCPITPSLCIYNQPTSGGTRQLLLANAGSPAWRP